MKRKTKEPAAREQEEVIAPQIIESAKRSLVEGPVASFEEPKVTVKCVVCGADAQKSADENLCWVCRRLKISAWRDSDHQMPAQE